MSNNVVVQVQGVVSYPNLFKPKRNNLSGKDEFSTDVLFSKKADIKVLNDAINAAIEKKFGNDKSKHPKNLTLPIKDGDAKGTPEYAGMYYITVKADAANNRVILCDNQLQPLQHESDIQGGDTVNVKVQVYAYDNIKKGVSCGLMGVQLVRKTDTPFNGRPRNAEDMFESLADDSYSNQNSKMFD
jgi:hypothetical protein